MPNIPPAPYAIYTGGPKSVQYLKNAEQFPPVVNMCWTLVFKEEPIND